MPTYNFTSDGDVLNSTNLIRTIDGPAVFTPRTDADYFTMSYLDGSDLYYWSDNLFQIDGSTFNGTLTEFCDAAEALFTTSTGGGAAYSDVTTNTIAEIGAEKTLLFTDSAAKALLTLSDTATQKNAGLGDIAGGIAAGPTSNAYVSRDTGSSAASSSIEASYDSYTTAASVSARAYETTAEVEISITTSGYSGGISINQLGVIIHNLPTYADNAAALTGGLIAGNLYRTGDTLKIVH